MGNEGKCQSCGMAIDDGIYCQYCVNDKGELQAFEERFERMVQWALTKGNGISREEAEIRTKEYMRTLPAWKDHPSLSQ